MDTSTKSHVGSRTCSTCGQSVAVGEWPFCPHGISCGGTRLKAFHPSERTVVLRNPRTGEIRYPPRNDSPIHPNYRRQGYVREELNNPQAIRDFERTTGRVHERTWCDPGSATAERSLSEQAERPVVINGLDG